jgi:hypothetical protein
MIECECDTVVKVRTHWGSPFPNRIHFSKEEAALKLLALLGFLVILVAPPSSRTEPSKSLQVQEC